MREELFYQIINASSCLLLLLEVCKNNYREENSSVDSG